jgi:hypothetical protein
MKGAAICFRMSNPHVDGWRYENLRALGFPCILTCITEAIVNAEVPLNAASFLASATLIPLNKLDPE